MKACDLREKYLSFFESKNHKRFKSASLIPENDPTVLFTTAGMHPLVPYLLGEKHPQGNRLTNVQKCIRTGDIDEVGDICHLTFFEMLGNWSLGDYFKREAIEYSFEFLTGSEHLNIPLENLAFSVFAGDADAPFDSEAFAIWRGLGVKESRIAKLGKKHNWWGPAGQTGPCGPDTEMFYWVGLMSAPEVFDPEDKNWVEIWNDVFMQYNKTADGNFEPLIQTNVDTGMGLERVTAVLQGKKSCYETELFIPLFAKLDEIRNVTDDVTRERSMHERIIVEHIRAASFIMADGVMPSNVDQGYILRRLIRRAIREARKIGVTEAFTSKIAGTVIENYAYFYKELSKNEERILKAFSDEENQFAHTLEKGTREFQKITSQSAQLTGDVVFRLFETYGFPIELSTEMASEINIPLSGNFQPEYMQAFEKHQELSRQGAEQKFKGGLADNSDLTTALHTATHLLHAALRKVLGEHVEQKGSNITAERLRFDFSHTDKMTPEQIAEVEKLVNEAIGRNLEVSILEATVDEAKNNGAIGLFEDKYADKVKVYSIGDFSKEICGGPHVNNTSSMGRFKIQKEESSSRGVRRIKAVLEK